MNLLQTGQPAFESHQYQEFDRAYFSVLVNAISSPSVKHAAQNSPFIVHHLHEIEEGVVGQSKSLPKRLGPLRIIRLWILNVEYPP